MNSHKIIEKESVNYSLSLSFENISLPPFEDILVITQKSPYGKIGVSSSLNLLQPDRFDLIEVDDEKVEAIIINKRILKRLPQKAILDILRKRVFPYIEAGEIVKVGFKVKISFEEIEVKVDTNT